LIVDWDLTLFNWPFYVLCRDMAFLFGCVSLIILKLFLRNELLAVPEAGYLDLLEAVGVGGGSLEAAVEDVTLEAVEAFLALPNDKLITITGASGFASSVATPADS